MNCLLLDLLQTNQLRDDHDVNLVDTLIKHHNERNNLALFNAIDNMMKYKDSYTIGRNELIVLLGLENP